MGTSVILIVVLSAALHAVMNCSLKATPDPVAASLMLAIGGGAVATPLVMLFGVPAMAALPYLAASALVHIVYWCYLGRSYASGEMGAVFPMARGLAPVLTTAVGVTLLGEHLTTSDMLAIGGILAGIFVIIASSLRLKDALNARVLGQVAIIAACTMGYTVIDAMGARAAGSAQAYVVYLYVLNGWLLLAYGVNFQRERLIAAISWGRWVGPLAGATSLLVYGASVWAMTKAPVPLVASLREVSVIFVIIIARLWLKENVSPGRWFGAALIVGSLAAVKLA